MAINSKSVIPVWLGDFNPKFYQKLCDLEDFLYGNPQASNQIQLPLGNFSQATSNAGITVTVNNLVVTNLVAAWRGARNNRLLGYGKWYWEVTLTNIVTNGPMIGVGRSDIAIGSPIYLSAVGYAYFAKFQQKYNNGAPVTYGAQGATIVNGTVVGVFFDNVNGTLRFAVDGVDYGQAFSGIVGTYYPSIDLYDVSAGVSVNLGENSFKYPPTGGFNQPYNDGDTDKSITALAPLVTALNTWKNTPRTTNLNDFVATTFGYDKISTLHNLDRTPLDAAKQENIFTFNGAVTTIMNAPIEYFKPVMSADLIPILVYQSINNLVTNINGAVASDAANMVAVKNNLVSLMQNDATNNILALPDSTTLYKDTLKWNIPLSVLPFPGITIPDKLKQ